jgi:hypothetical protein
LRTHAARIVNAWEVMKYMHTFRNVWTTLGRTHLKPSRQQHHKNSADGYIYISKSNWAGFATRASCRRVQAGAGAEHYYAASNRGTQRSTNTHPNRSVSVRERTAAVVRPACVCRTTARRRDVRGVSCGQHGQMLVAGVHVITAGVSKYGCFVNVSW